MSNIIKTQLPCNDCGSSDGLVERDDNSTFCFSCRKNTMNNSNVSNKVREAEAFEEVVQSFTMDGIDSHPSNAIPERKISKEVVEHFGVKMGFDSNGTVIEHCYPYSKNGSRTAYKVRTLPKDFKVIGDFKDVELFGQAQATYGKKKIIITEGELDALAIAQANYNATGKCWNVVAIPSASGLRNLLDQRDWLNSFQEIVLAFDMDEAGQSAMEKAAKMFKAGKVKIVSLPEKDPCEVLIKHGSKVLDQAIFTAKPWSPAGIVVGEQVWDQFVARQSVESIPYPACLDGLNHKLKGIRQGEITLFTSGTGSGKSTVIKEIILDLLDKTDDKIGLISLEESVGDTAEKFISMSLNRSVNDPPPATEEELRQGFEKVFGDERLVLLDHQGSVGDSSLIDKIEYMALMGCKYLVLDHITIAVSEGSDGLSGNEAVDKMMSDLLKVVKRHNVWLGLISHLRKASGGGQNFEEGKLASIDDIKGSGSIKQISFDIIAFARNLVAEDESERNTIKFRVLKSRFTGFTGDAGAATYDIKTTRLKAAGEFDFEAMGL